MRLLFLYSTSPSNRWPGTYHTMDGWNMRWPQRSFRSATLNIQQYNGGGGRGGVHLHLQRSFGMTRKLLKDAAWPRSDLGTSLELSWAAAAAAGETIGRLHWTFSFFLNITTSESLNSVRSVRPSQTIIPCWYHTLWLYLLWFCFCGVAGRGYLPPRHPPPPPPHRSTINCGVFDHSDPRINVLRVWN